MKMYNQDHLDILYEAIRHKVAHIAHPYAVFDTSTKPKVFGSSPKRRIAWTVYASKRKPAIQIVHRLAILIAFAPTVWRESASQSV
jgi:hypothetical protein